MKLKFVVKKEKMGGDWYWMIYQRLLWIDFFLERWNTEASCMARLYELRNPESIELRDKDMHSADFYRGYFQGFMAGSALKSALSDTDFGKYVFRWTRGDEK